MSDERRVKKLNTKKKFVADGVFNAELNAFLTRVLGMEGYAGIEVRATSVSTEIRIRAAKHDELMEKGARRVREIKSLIEKRYNFNDEDNKVELTIRPLQYDRALCAAANAENLKFKLLSGTPVRMAVNNIMGNVMRRNAVGCEVIVSGKVRGQRAKAQKYSSGYQISTGQPKKEFIDVAVRHINMRQGVLGVKVKIMMSLEEKSVRRPKSCQTSSRSTTQRMRTETSFQESSSPNKEVSNNEKSTKTRPKFVNDIFN